MKSIFFNKAYLFIECLRKIYISGRYQSYRRGKFISVGEGSYGMSNIKLSIYGECNFTPVVIGKYCSIGPCVEIILGGDHPKDNNALYPIRVKLLKERKALAQRDSVSIGNDVWIASNVTIISGVTLGDGCVVMANSLVTKSFPRLSVVGGHPARVVAQRKIDNSFDSWWDSPEEWLRKNAKDLNRTI